MNNDTKLKVVEIFRSIQGEGANSGKQAIFIRLSNCNLNCWFCDTDWNRGTEMTVNEVMEEVEKLQCSFIIWTGGEPTLQLTDEIVRLFGERGFYQAIETNGTNKVPDGIDYITCSPKVSAKLLKRSFDDNCVVNELRYPFGVGEVEPPTIDELPMALNYFVSPIFLGNEKQRFEYSPENIQACLDFINKDPRWKLSLQIHKILNIR